MQIGFNNDVSYREHTFHIQTEDRGMEAAKIETHIFHSGNILDSNVLSYEKVVSADELDEAGKEDRIKSMMRHNHRLLYQRLTSGDYDHLVGLAPLTRAEQKTLMDLEPFDPSQDRVSEKVMEIEQGKRQPIDVAAMSSQGEAVSLTELRQAMSSGKATAAPKPAAGPSIGMTASGIPPSITPPRRAHASTVRTAPIHAAATETFDWPDTGVSAYNGIHHTELTLDVTELVQQLG